MFRGNNRADWRSRSARLQNRCGKLLAPVSLILQQLCCSHYWELNGFWWFHCCSNRVPYRLSCFRKNGTKSAGRKFMAMIWPVWRALDHSALLLVLRKKSSDISKRPRTFWWILLASRNWILVGKWYVDFYGPVMWCLISSGTFHNSHIP